MDSSRKSNGHIIELNDIHVIFGDYCALDIEHLAFDKSERVFVLGSSGSGKTTLSRIIKGRLAPSTGTVEVYGVNPVSVKGKEKRANQRRVAMIDQEFFLVPRLSVVGNVLSGCLGRVSPWRSLLSWYPSSEWKKVEEILQEVELNGLGHRKVETLSGGQRQRTAIARALMQEADVIVADEPVSNLDPELAEEALEVFVDCAKRRGVTLIVNLHQPSLARRYATRLIGLADGKIVYDGPPEELTDELADYIYRGDLRVNAAKEEVRNAGSSETMEEGSSDPTVRVIRG